MMSQRSKRELLEEIRPRYRAAKKTEKQYILNEFVAATSYHRKYAIRILKQEGYRKHTRKRGRQKIYQGEVVIALEQIWEICGRICSKRLHPFLPEMVKVLERCGELQLPADTRALLLKMSRSSIDRCLNPIRRQPHPHGFSTTKPGSLLKKAIPVQTYTPWNEQKPGFMEIDLVAHCGVSPEGQFAYTLTCVDICTGWTECLPVFPRSKQTVFEAIKIMRSRLPFNLLGIDSDNGSEFINDLLFHYCDFQKISFTRSRPYQKTIRLMSNRKTGLSSVASSVMIASTPSPSSCYSRVSTRTCASTSTSSSRSSNWSPNGGWTIRPPKDMIRPLPPINVSKHPLISPRMTKPAWPTNTSISILSYCVPLSIRKSTNFGKSHGNILI